MGLLSAADGIKKHLVSSVLSNPILTPSHVPMWCRVAPQHRLGNSTNDPPGNSQRAAVTCSFAAVPLLHRARVWFLTGRPSFCFLCSLTSITCSFHSLYHLLPWFLSLSVCPWHSVSLLDCPPPPPLLSLRPASLSPSHLLLPSPALQKYLLDGPCASCRNTSCYCILSPQCNNKTGVSSCLLHFLPLSSPSLHP